MEVFTDPYIYSSELKSIVKSGGVIDPDYTQIDRVFNITIKNVSSKIEKIIGKISYEPLEVVVINVDPTKIDQIIKAVSAEIFYILGIDRKEASNWSGTYHASSHSITWTHDTLSDPFLLSPHQFKSLQSLDSVWDVSGIAGLFTLGTEPWIPEIVKTVSEPVQLSQWRNVWLVRESHQYKSLSLLINSYIQSNYYVIPKDTYKILSAGWGLKKVFSLDEDVFVSGMNYNWILSQDNINMPFRMHHVNVSEPDVIVQWKAYFVASAIVYEYPVLPVWIEKLGLFKCYCTSNQSFEMWKKELSELESRDVYIYDLSDFSESDVKSWIGKNMGYRISFSGKNYFITMLEKGFFDPHHPSEVAKPKKVKSPAKVDKFQTLYEKWSDLSGFYTWMGFVKS